MTDTPATAYTADLRVELDELIASKADLIAEIAANLGPDAEETFAEMSDAMSANLAAKAANTTDDEDLQEDYIAEVEAWVADNVSNGDVSTRIAAYIWSVGETDAKFYLTQKTAAQP